MKKVLSALIVLLMLVALLAACGGPAQAEPTEAVVSEPTPQPTATPTAPPTPEPTPAPTPAETPAIEPVSAPDWAYETIGGLQLEIPAAEVVSLLGEPEKKDEASVWGVDGRVYQLWSYASKGVEMYMAWEPDQPKTASLYRFTVKSPFSGKTPRGIGIGSTKEEVLAAYKEGIDPQENNSENEVIVGSIFGGILFDVSNGKVASISFGAFAE